MSRIKEIAPGEMTGEQTTVFEQLTAGRGRILTPYKVWIHSPKVAAGMEHIGTFLNKKSSLSTRGRDLHHPDRTPLARRVCTRRPHPWRA